MAILVLLDNHNDKISKGALEAVSYAHQIALNSGDEVTALSYGKLGDSLLKAVGQYGAKTVWHHADLHHPTEDQLTALCAAAMEKLGASMMVCPFDGLGKSVAPRLAAKIGAGYVAGAISLPEISGSELTVKKNVFSGKAIATVKVKTQKKIIGLMPNSVPVVTSDATAEIEAFKPEIPKSGVRVVEIRAEAAEGIPLPEAEIVVSAGRGLKGPENWGMVEDLAHALGAATACSRPVADIGWRPHHEHVGQTGIAIRPNLYIAAGISGAIQHLAGVNGSKTIVVINTDKEAPFFKAADYGIIGDVFEVLPRLTEAVKKFKAAN